MRFNGLALVAGAMAIVACSGGDKNAQNTSATQNDTAAAPATQNTGANASGANASGGTAAMAPVTGKMYEVKMIGDGTTYKFEPANITIKPGDGVKWIMVSGGPHNVDFLNAPAAAKAQLSANMPNQMKELTSPMLMTPNETYQVSFANIGAGKYDYQCDPHAAMGMKGSVTVQ